MLKLNSAKFCQPKQTLSHLQVITALADFSYIILVYQYAKKANCYSADKKTADCGYIILAYQHAKKANYYSANKKTAADI